MSKKTRKLIASLLVIGLVISMITSIIFLAN